MLGINQKNKINRLTNTFIKDFTVYDIRKNFIEFWAESNFINIHGSIDIFCFWALVSAIVVISNKKSAFSADNSNTRFTRVSPR